MARLQHHDDRPQSRETWENYIHRRKKNLDDAPPDGDPRLIQQAPERLDRALDGYSRDVTNGGN